MQPRAPQRQRQDIILGVLYAVGTDWEDIPGTPRPYTLSKRLRLRLTLTLYDHYLAKEFGPRSPFSFAPDTYGPTVHGLDTLLDMLEQDGRVWTRTTAQGITEYQLVAVEEGQQVVNEMGDRGELLRWIVSRHAQRSLGAMLSFASREADEHFSELQVG